MKIYDAFIICVHDSFLRLSSYNMLQLQCRIAQFTQVHNES